jgi:hypothetical protein
MDSPREVTTPHPSATSEHARNFRARAWAYVFDCYRKKEAAPESRPDDAERSLNDGARSIIQES